jgi:hypothetical protein
MGIRSLSAASISTGAKRSKFWDQSAVIVLPPAPVYDSISSYLATGTVSDITLGSIPSTYRHLQIRVMGFSNNFGSIFMEINGDTTNANYQSTGIWGQHNVSAAQTAGILRGRPAVIAGVGSGQFGTTYPYVLIIDILD